MTDQKKVVEILLNMAKVLEENKEFLTDLDNVIGDGDHGINMARGFAEVEKQAESLEQKDIGNILKTVGMTLVSKVGGSSGPLYGTAFMKAVTDGADFDIVILDLYLPDMDGISILKNLVQRNYQTPILIYSKASSKEVVLNVLSLGAKCYLVKPQKPGTIVNKVLEILHSNR